MTWILGVLHLCFPIVNNFSSKYRFVTNSMLALWLMSWCYQLVATQFLCFWFFMIVAAISLWPSIQLKLALYLEPRFIGVDIESDRQNNIYASIFASPIVISLPKRTCEYSLGHEQLTLWLCGINYHYHHFWNLSVALCSWFRCFLGPILCIN